MLRYTEFRIRCLWNSLETLVIRHILYTKYSPFCFTIRTYISLYHRIRNSFFIVKFCVHSRSKILKSWIAKLQCILRIVPVIYIGIVPYLSRLKQLLKINIYEIRFFQRQTTSNLTSHFTSYTVLCKYFVITRNRTSSLSRNNRIL